jgi:hypothetical protein
MYCFDSQSCAKTVVKDPLSRISKNLYAFLAPRIRPNLIGLLAWAFVEHVVRVEDLWEKKGRERTPCSVRCFDTGREKSKNHPLLFR